MTPIRSQLDRLRRDVMAGQFVRLGDTGGDSTIPDMLEATVDSYDATNMVATFTGTPQELPTGTPDASGVTKAYNKYAITVNPTDTILAIHWEGVYDDTGTHGTHGQVDWVILPFEGGTTGVVTRNFKLTDPLYTAETTADWVWLEDDLATECGVTDSYLMADPRAEFSGLTGAIGRATLVYDPCNFTTRWEITHLESPADYICATTAATYSGLEIDATVNHYWGPDWHRENPGATVKVIGCYPTDLPNLNKVICAFESYDAVGVHYRFIDFLQALGCGLEYASGFLRLSSGPWGDGLSFTAETAPGAGDCSIDVNVGCGLEIVTDTVKVKPADLAGTGLTPGTGCSLDVQIDGTYLYYDGGGGYLTVLNTTLTVLTGCASPSFVTFDASGNPTFNFTTANIRILEVVSTGTATCSADGTLSCT